MHTGERYDRSRAFLLMTCMDPDHRNRTPPSAACDASATVSCREVVRRRHVSCPTLLLQRVSRSGASDVEAVGAFSPSQPMLKANGSRSWMSDVATQQMSTPRTRQRDDHAGSAMVDVTTPRSFTADSGRWTRSCRDRSPGSATFLLQRV